MWYDEDGVQHFNCNICRDRGLVHPLKEDGKPDYSRVVKCRCRAPGYQPPVPEQFGFTPQKKEGGG